MMKKKKYPVWLIILIALVFLVGVLAVIWWVGGKVYSGAVGKNSAAVRENNEVTVTFYVMPMHIIGYNHSERKVEGNQLIITPYATLSLGNLVHFSDRFVIIREKDEEKQIHEVIIRCQDRDIVLPVE